MANPLHQCRGTHAVSHFISTTAIPRLLVSKAYRQTCLCRPGRWRPAIHLWAECALPNQRPPTSAQADKSRSHPSGFTKRSTVAKPAEPRAIPASKPADEPAPEPSRPPRPTSSFARRSPVPHSSDRAPVSTSSGVPVAVSPTVTPARKGRAAPSAGAPLTGVRERTEAPVPTQERLRGKSQFVPEIAGRRGPEVERRGS